MEVLPGLKLLPAPGHTPGHLALAITSGREGALYLGFAGTLLEPWPAGTHGADLAARRSALPLSATPADGRWSVVRLGENGEKLAVRWSDEARPATAPWRRQMATTVEVAPRTFAATHRSRPL
jgi:glyoxylase-like metal-dependent hydrolase (beta-lactamase superfamily II)